MTFWLESYVGKCSARAANLNHGPPKMFRLRLGKQMFLGQVQGPSLADIGVRAALA